MLSGRVWTRNGQGNHLNLLLNRLVSQCPDRFAKTGLNSNKAPSLSLQKYSPNKIPILLLLSLQRIFIYRTERFQVLDCYSVLPVPKPVHPRPAGTVNGTPPRWTVGFAGASPENAP